MRKNWMVVVALVCVISLIGGCIAHKVNLEESEKEITTKGPKETATESDVDVTTDPIVEETTTEETTTKGAKEKNIDPNKWMVALTFDDGPYTDGRTDKIVDVCEANPGTAVTFFHLGDRMKTHVELVQREEAVGCEVGAHSMSHKRLTELSLADLQKDFENQQAVFQEILGHDITVYRPPYGRFDDNVKTYVKAPLIIWTVDTLDWKYDNTQKLIDTIQKEAENGGLDGKVVLMHETKQSTADAMETIIPWLVEQGYQVVTVSDLAEYGFGEKLEAGKSYGYKFFVNRDLGSSGD
ncbi:MAG: polysaccharide deacetylase family protein [Lachnospiraceae bacterium]|nr:polysaccharide deacetylase family protein [Lachnospiraceae bacterium]